MVGGSGQKIARRSQLVRGKTRATNQIHAALIRQLEGCVGDARWFPSPRHMVAYVGLDPRVRQSGSSLARHGHFSKQGSAAARHVLCEAANATMRSPGPLRAFGQRIQNAAAGRSRLSPSPGS